MLNKQYQTNIHNLTEDYLFHFTDKTHIRAYPIQEEETPGIPVSLTGKSKGLYFHLSGDTIQHISPGDMYLATSKGTLRKVFSATSTDNVLFTTNQCNNHCLMCSQPPPTRKNDIDFHYHLNTLILCHMPPQTTELGITGGEPTLTGSKLNALIRTAYDKNPGIALHILSNGRAFANRRYTSTFATFADKNIVIGIPLHSDYEDDHNKIAGNNQAYRQTLTGLYNLARYNIPKEIRIVINRINYKRLPQIATHIFRNFPFVKHVAFMGMEYRGLILKNYHSAGIDPVDYSPELTTAVQELSSWGIKTSIYNIPLCLLNESIHPFAQRSISDWKESYSPACNNCRVKADCCGLFSTSHIQSSNISPL